jgi:hypothetical protein
MNFGAWNRCRARDLENRKPPVPSWQDRYIAKWIVMSEEALLAECTGAWVTYLDLSRPSEPMRDAPEGLAGAEKRWFCCMEVCQARKRLDIWEAAEKEAKRRGL